MTLKNNIIVYTLSTVLLIVVALYNGFPLVHPDSAAYIEQAIYPHFSPERTPFYGLFMKISSLHISLWLTIALQSAIVSFLLLQYIKLFIGSEASLHSLSYLIAVISIVILTGGSWVVSHLMPDVFSAILLLSILLFFTHKSATLYRQGLYAVIILLAISMHFSHIAIVCIVAVFLLSYSFKKTNTGYRAKSILLLGLCGGFFIVMCTANAIKKHGFVFARGKEVYMMAKLTENGILQKYLKTTCPTTNQELCNFKNKLPSSMSEFLLSGESPLYKMGGWDSSSSSFNVTLSHIFSSPEYVSQMIQKTITGTLKQITKAALPPELTPQNKNSETFKKVNNYFPDEAAEFEISMQQRETLKTSTPNFIHLLFFAISTLWLMIYHNQALSPFIIRCYSIIVVFILANAVVVAFFGSVDWRFHYRIFWLLPATNLLVMMRYYSDVLYNKLTVQQ